MKYIICFFVLVNFGCNSNLGGKSKDKENIFKINLTIKVLQDDKFQLFFTTKPKEEFNDHNRIFIYVNKAILFQEVLFKLPKGQIPKKIRIDLGENFNTSDIIIKEIKLTFNKKSIVVNKNAMSYFFKENIYLKYNPNFNVFKPQIVNGKYDPYILSTPLLNKKIEIEF